MYQIQSSVLFLISLFVFTICSDLEATDKPRRNVLFIAVDDLRPELGCYGASHIHSPNIDALAKTGRVFQHAYCQQAVCNPSRTSLMTGMRPNTIGVIGNHSHFRSNHPDVVTLPQHFKNHGYHASAIGKIFHGVFPEGASITKWDTMGDPESWSEPAVRFGPRYYYTEEGIAAAKNIYHKVYKPKNPMPDDWTKKLVFGPATESPDVADDTLYDGKVAEAAVKKLRELKQNNTSFFLAVGFIKPHSPYIAPKKYFDLYKDVALPKHTSFPKNAPSFAGHSSGELRRYTDQPNKGSFSEANKQRVRHAYYACISYIDAQIGRVLKELDRSGLSKNTIVVLYGDHGYHLGEQGLWGKTTNYELDTRVPLIVRLPGMNAPGKASSSLVELVDLYPTLAELAGLPLSEQLEGTSLTPILDNPDNVTKNAAISQYPRAKNMMGYSLRTPTHRLTQWIDRVTGQTRATELYDYSKGVVEQENIANSSPELVQQLNTQLISFIKENQVTTTETNSQNALSFEEQKPGSFKELKTSIGVWQQGTGKTIVDAQHAKTGKHCLQLTGGKETSVTLNIADDVDTSGNMKFWAERWTRREPFTFRIEKDSGTGWTEIFNGDKQIQVGRAFLSHVTVPLNDKSIKQLRFIVSSPPNTGILIDDIKFAPALPQNIVGVEAIPVTLPALIGRQANPLFKLKIEVEGALNPISLTELNAILHCGKGDIESSQVYFTGENDQFSDATLFGEQSIITARETAKTKHTFQGELKLVDGSNYVWISCKLNEDANIDQRIKAECLRVSFSNNKSFDLSAASTQRLGVTVRNGGDDGVHTYRIPGLATTNKGSLIGVYDVRRRTGGDLPGDIDVGMSRSIDGGRSWEPMKIIMDMGDDPNWRYDGIGDPAVLVDKNTGTIWVAATWSHGNRSWFGSGPGLEPEETGQLMLVKSDDDGVTWSKPINITKQVKKPEWSFILQGPGKGITMRDGTIVFAAQYQDPPNKSDKRSHRLPHSTIIYSKDHGVTWNVGTGAFDDTTEAQVVEIKPGVLMLNCRYNRRATRVVMITRDMGKTWEKHPTSERSLVEPGSCMASLINVDQEVRKDLGDWLLFSNPDSTRGRNHITIKGSPDQGLTWPKENRLLLDEGSGRGYSCMSMIDENTIGILYEGSQAHLTFQRISLRDVIGDKEQVPTQDLSSKSKQLSLPNVFGNHMVLQAEAQIPIWGTSLPNTEVTVTLGNERKVTTTDDSGEWMVRMDKRVATLSPTKLTVNSDSQQIVLSDIVIGEVWVCAGQSNMEWPLRQSDNGAKELSQVNLPTLRLLHLKGGALGSSGSYSPDHLARLTPEKFAEGAWEVASAESAKNFSAVAWYFGKEIQKKLNVPVGLICPAVGGTPVEAWIPREALQFDPNLKGLVAGNWLDNDRLGDFCKTRGVQNLMSAMQEGHILSSDQYGPNHSFKPGFMWEAGIKPLVPFAIRGAIWYQGESNAETRTRIRDHGELFPLLIHQWRKHWGQSEFPFLFVQLPAINRAGWPLFREGQRRALDKVSNVGMAITMDTGHPTNVHPGSKKVVGDRLAKWALATTYQVNSSESYSGPLFEKMHREDDSLVITFKHFGNGLQSSDGMPLRYFEIAGEDGVFHQANAVVTNKQTLAVSSAEVTEPIEVRYAWVPYSSKGVNFINSDGLPASPFTSEQSEVLFRDKTPPKNRPNILFIVSEDNSEHLGSYGEERVFTPHLDKLAENGVRYTNAYVPYSVCSPSRAAFLTGLYTRQTGHIGLATHRFSMFRDFKTMPAYFQNAGYYTGLLGKTHVNPERVVEDFIDHRAIKNSNFGKTISIEEYAKEAELVIKNSAKQNKPFLLIINYADAHRSFVKKSKNGYPTRLVEEEIEPFPWIGSDSPHLREELKNYFNCMNRLDEAVGMVLSKLNENGVRDNTMVIYISDHGADFPRGKGSIYENGTKIPMIVNHSKTFPEPKVENSLVSTIDILPTMLMAAKLKVPASLQGVALQNIYSGKAQKRKYIHTFTTGSSPNLLYMQFGIRDDRYKLVYNPDRALNRLAVSRYQNSRLSKDQHVATFLNPPEYELFDLKNDPYEWNNLAEQKNYASIKQRLSIAMKEFQRHIKDPFENRKNIETFIAEQKEYLNKRYKTKEFQWPHLEMFKKAQLPVTTN